LIRLTDVEPPRGQTVAEARSVIEEEIRAERADELYIEQTERLIDLVYADPTGLAETADDMGLELETTGPFSRFNAPGALADPAVLEAIFSDLVLIGRQTSEPIEVDRNRAVVVRVTDRGVFARMLQGEAADDGPAPVRFDLFGWAFDIGVSTWLGIGALLAVAAIGGGLLNLTPCVLPVIPIKIMTISQHAGSPGRSWYLGLWMAAGVIAFWLGLGIPVAFVSGFVDPSQIFGIWWVTAGIGAVIVLMALGLMGMFQITLPQRVYMVNPKADNAQGSFLFGVMTAVLGLPCFGFVAGALLAGAATMPWYQVLAIFFFLGVGMALPYLVLSAKPSWVEKIPRTGPASELVKQVLGLLLVAAGAYFIGSGLIGLVSERPWMGRQLHWWAVALFVLLAGGWLVYRTFQISRKPAPRIVFTLLSLSISAAIFVYVSDQTASAKESFLERQGAMQAAAESGELLTTTWIEYTPALHERALDEGYTVVLDFTAEWCLNCKALKAAVLNKDPVKSRLREDSVVSMTVDLTSRSAPGWTLLRDELGQTGIPLLVVEKKGAERWMSNAYTSGQVLSALDRAQAERTAAR